MYDDREDLNSASIYISEKDDPKLSSDNLIFINKTILKQQEIYYNKILDYLGNFQKLSFNNLNMSNSNNIDKDKEVNNQFSLNNLNNNIDVKESLIKANEIKQNFLDLSTKLMNYNDYISKYVSQIRFKNKIIDEINRTKKNLSLISNKKLKALNNIYLAKSALQKFNFLEKISTTEKNLIQSALIVGNKEKLASNNLTQIIPNPNINSINDFINEQVISFNPEYNFPHEFGKLTKSSLFIDRVIKLEDPIFVYSSITERVKPNTIIFLKYPDKASRKTKLELESDKDIYFKYTEIFFTDNEDEDLEGDVNKVPSFCNGKRYEDTGIIITRNVSIKAVACCDFYSDSNVVNISFTVTNEAADINIDDPNYALYQNHLDNIGFHNENDVKLHNNLFNKPLMRETVLINKDIGSEIKPLTFENEGDTPMGTDGSFYTGSIYKRKSEAREDDEGI